MSISDFELEYETESESNSNSKSDYISEYYFENYKDKQYDKFQLEKDNNIYNVNITKFYFSKKDIINFSLFDNNTITLLGDISERCYPNHYDFYGWNKDGFLYDCFNSSQLIILNINSNEYYIKYLKPEEFLICNIH